MLTTIQNRDFVSHLLPQYPLDEAIYWIAKNLRPADVFDASQLEEWAEENGYAVNED